MTIFRNAASEAVANNIKGTMAIPHPYGRLQFGADLDLHFATLIGTGRIPTWPPWWSSESKPVWTNRVVEGIAKTGKPVAGFGIEKNGDLNTICAASRKAKEFVQWASELQREECPVNELWVSCKCGESDTTSGLADQSDGGRRLRQAGNRPGARWCSAKPPKSPAASTWWSSVAPPRRWPRSSCSSSTATPSVVDDHKTNDLCDSQPTKGNIEGGLTTIEEKALGNIQKIGKKCKVIGALDKAEVPTGPGLWFMDSSSAAAEMVTLCAASGFVVHLFPTGQGNIIGNPILPVIKLSSNPRTVRTMAEHVDVDVSGLLRRELNLDQAGDKLLECMFRTANGRLTSAEALGHREFVITRLYESA